MLAPGLFSYLTGKAAVTALVGTRVYPEVLQESPTLPAIVYEIGETVERVRSLTGPSGLVGVNLTIECWSANSMLEARTLSEVIRDEMDGFAGSWGTTTIRGCFLNGDPDEIQFSPDLAGFRRWGVEMHFEVWYAESKPAFA